MQKKFNYILIIIFINCYFGCSCRNESAPNPTYLSRTPASPTNISTLPFHWNIDTITDSGLTVAIGNSFSEGERTAITVQMEHWNESHNDFDFFTANKIIDNINSDNLDDYVGGDTGVYQSYSWFSNVSSNALAVTQFFVQRKYAGTSAEYAELIHSDIIFNYRDYIFDPSHGSYSRYDFSSTALHELGHFLGLRHDFEQSTAVMSPWLDLDDKKDSLTPFDIDQLESLYSTAQISALTVLKLNYTIKEDPTIYRGLIEYYGGSGKLTKFGPVLDPSIYTLLNY